MRACLYGRFSTDNQKDRSIADQFRECERTAKEAGFEVVARFSDSAITAGTASRPGYQAMLAAARAHKFDILIVEDISRLWRNRAEFGPRSAELEDLGVDCVTCTGDDTRRDGWGLVIQIKQAMAEHARREASYRSRRGLEGRALAGESTGGRCYGYMCARDSGTGRIEIQPEQAKIVRRIFKLYADGNSPRTIASMLNSEGIQPPGWRYAVRPNKRQWLASTLSGTKDRGNGILNNVRYVGQWTWGRASYKPSAVDALKHRRVARAKPLSSRTDERLRIVSQDVWVAVKARQEMLQETLGAAVKRGHRQRAPGGGRPPKHVLSGLLECASCGAAYALSGGSKYYQCSSYVQGADCANRGSVRREALEAVVFNHLRKDLCDPTLVEEVERRVRAALRRRISDTEVNGPRIERLRREVDNLADAIASGALKNSPALAQRLSAAETELERLLKAKATRPLAETKIAPRIRERFAAIVERLDEHLRKAAPERAQTALLAALRGRIVLQPDSMNRHMLGEYELGTMLDGGTEISVTPRRRQSSKTVRTR